MLNEFYVIGGRQRAPRPLSAGNRDWNGYEQGVILQINTASGERKEALCYVSPSEVVAPDDAAITFQADSIKGQVLYVCTQTEVLVYRLPEFEQLGYLSLPIFNIKKAFLTSMYLKEWRDSIHFEIETLNPIIQVRQQVMNQIFRQVKAFVNLQAAILPELW